jgi:hypothetical protein
VADDITGTDWTDAQNDLIVADYFSMLTAELAGHSYVKSDHNSALQALTGRTRGSIERKHMNISAVMGRLGLPRIKGYLPYANFQNGLIDAVDRYLANQADHREGVEPIVASLVAENQAVWRGLTTDQAPRLLTGYEEPPLPSLDEIKSTVALDRLVRKFDPAARDARNRSLGRQGEELIFEYERTHLRAHGRDDLARRVEWTSQERGDGAGYDIGSFSLDGRERLIEVKTTSGPARTPFFLSENERKFSEERPTAFRLVRLYDFAQLPSAFELAPPLVEHLSLIPVSYRALVR